MSKARSSEKGRAFDTVVLGGGLTGLMIANALARALGERVAIVDEHDSLGGQDRPHLSTFGKIGHGLKFVPATELTERGLGFLKELYLPELDWQRAEIPPVTYESGSLKPFVGFGAKNLEAMEQILLYSAAERLTPTLPSFQWVEALAGEPALTSFLKSFVTRFHFQRGQGKDPDLITAVEINGKDRLEASRFVFADQPVTLLKSDLKGELSARFKQKLSKADFWTSINLELFHGQQVTESPSMHVLWSPSETESPCVGQFLPASAQNESGKIRGQHSQWTTFVPFDLTSDNERTGNAIRRMKKQIKRVYSGAFENLQAEIIFVAPGSHGHGPLSSETGLKLAPFDNLYVCGPQLEATGPLEASLTQAERLLAAWNLIEPLSTAPPVATLRLPSSDACATGVQQL